MARLGLFVGINDYKNGISSLSCAREDALALWQAFARDGYDLPAASLMPDGTATQEKVIHYLRNLNLQAGDIFVFYFSGHGCEINGSHYLLSSSADAALINHQIGLIPVSLVCQLTNVPGVRRLFILDSCRSEIWAAHRGVKIECPATRDPSLKPLTEQNPGETDIIPPLILTSCGTGEQSYEDLDGGQGVFTSALLEVLKNPQVDSFSIFRQALRNCVQRKVSELIPGRRQTISWNGDIDQDLPLLARWGNYTPQPHAPVFDDEDDEPISPEGDIFDTLSLGDIVSGHITTIMQYGAFVELAPGVEGLIHVSDMGGQLGNEAADFVSKGEYVECEVISIDLKKRRIGLKLQKKEEEEEDIFDTLSLGDIVSGHITTIMKAGAFVELAPGVEGLIHVSDMGGQPGNKAADFVSEGEYVECEVISIAPEKRRIGLKLQKNAEETDAAVQDEALQKNLKIAMLVDIGGKFFFGDGVEKDEEMAVKLWRQAAELGSAEAQFILGECYYNGDGTEKNEQLAVYWYRKAAEQNNTDAKERLDVLLKK